jgi:hypothetical protein
MTYELITDRYFCHFIQVLQQNWNQITIQAPTAYLFVLSRTSNFSAIWRLSPLQVTGLQI